MKVLMVAGGGGHFAAALAVRDGLPADWDCLFVVRQYTFEGDIVNSLEYQAVQKLGIPYRALSTGRLQRNLSVQTPLSLLRLPVGFGQAMKILLSYKPEVVVSFGGYVAVPITLAASILRIPIVLHEQTLKIGLSHRIAIPLASKISLSWETSKAYFPAKKSVLTGNPIRTFHDISLPVSISGENLPLIYITGGSSGAHVINLLVEESLDKLLEKFRIVHQTGDSAFHDFERLKEKKDSLPVILKERYAVEKFFDHYQVGSIIKTADFVVSRAGINIITELMTLGKPAILIPIPFAQKNEQRNNAIFFQQTGLGKMIEQNALSKDVFLQTISDFSSNLSEYQSHVETARAVIQKDAAQRIIAVIDEVGAAHAR